MVSRGNGDSSSELMRIKSSENGRIFVCVSQTREPLLSKLHVTLMPSFKLYCVRRKPFGTSTAAMATTGCGVDRKVSRFER